MRRGDVVVVAAAGDYGKPRPAVIVQSDAFPESHAYIVICQMTTDLVDAPDFACRSSRARQMDSVRHRR